MLDHNPQMRISGSMQTVVAAETVGTELQELRRFGFQLSRDYPTGQPVLDWTDGGIEAELARDLDLIAISTPHSWFAREFCDL